MFEYFKYNFDGYIFDCDGTLAESMPLHFKAWQYSLQQCGAKFEFTWELFRSTAGMGLGHLVDLLNERFNENLDLGVLLEIQEACVAENILKMQANTEVAKFAHWVVDQGFKLSVASGGHREIVHRTLNIIGLKELFPIIVTQDDVKKSKPDPEIFLLAAQKMDVQPHRCLVLEDSLLGIQGALTGGMSAVLVRFD